MYNTSPDPLFISGDARPLVNETPSATLLLLMSVVIPELNVVSTEPVPPEKAIWNVVDSNGNCVERFFTFKTSVWSWLLPKYNDLSWIYLITFVSLSNDAIYPNAVSPVPTVCCNKPPIVGVPDTVESLIALRDENVLPVYIEVVPKDVGFLIKETWANLASIGKSLVVSSNLA